MPLAIRVHAPGGPEALQCDHVPLPVPAPGEALVRHTALGVNFIDTYHRSGLYPLPELPHAIGVEGVGVVEAVGRGVSTVRVGDRVGYGGGEPGAYAEYRCVDSARLIALPESISDETAAAVLLRGMTAEYLIRRCFKVEAGMPVLVHAAVGGVGMLLCQWLAHLGAEVIGTVGTDAKAELARANGCQHVIVYTREDFALHVRQITHDRGVPVVFDGVGKATFAGSLRSLARRGLLVSFGNASGPPDPLDVLQLGKHGSVYLTRPRLHDYIASRAELELSANAVFDAVAKGGLRPRIGARFPMAAAADAHRALEARTTTGSVLLVP